MENAEYTLDDFCTWKVDALSKRALKIEGNKATLVARAFAAWEMQVPISKSSAQLQTEKNIAYETLLKVDLGSSSIVLPDPLKDVSAWISETEGIKDWPPIYFNDICVFILSKHPGKDVGMRQRMLNEYKEGKAYRYFDNDWLKEVFFYPVNDADYCFLKADCTPSQRLSHLPHQVWVCAHKTKGDIKSAYCSCTAGLGETCNHVAALLYRVEAAFRLGVTNQPPCTSLPCKWTPPSKRNNITPKMIYEMDWKKTKHGGFEKRPLISSKKQLFLSMKKTAGKTESNKGAHQQLADALSSALPNSCFMLVANAMKEMNKSSQVDIHCQATIECPLSPTTEERTGSHLKMKSLVEPYKCHHNYQESHINTKAKAFVKSMPTLSPEDVAQIEQTTVSQSDCIDWFEFREGRITASKFYAVYTRVKSIKKEQMEGKSVNIDSLLSTIMNYKPLSHDIPSLKYGRNMEKEAKEFYNNKMKKEHRDFGCRDCGLFLDMEKPYLGATPDQLVHCKCCGEGLLEIKCPYSVRHTKPDPENLDYITFDKEANICKLKTNHSYYAQVQGQMAITQRKWCDFFVYTAHGYYLERVTFSETYWLDICQNLDYFWMIFLSEELVSGQVYERLNKTE